MVLQGDLEMGWIWSCDGALNSERPPRWHGGAVFPGAGHLIRAHLPASESGVVTADLVVRLRDDLRNFDVVSCLIDGDEGEVGRGDVAKGLGANIFHHGFDPDLHGGAEGAIDTGFEDQQVANVDGSDEVDVIHRGGYGERPGVAAGGGGGDQVDELHESATEEVAESVGVGGKDDLAALGLRGAHGACVGSVGHSSIVIAPCLHLERA